MSAIPATQEAEVDDCEFEINIVRLHLKVKDSHKGSACHCASVKNDGADNFAFQWIPIHP